jgi:two-component system, LytTR family, response regulator
MQSIIIYSQSGNHQCEAADVLRIESSSNYSRIFFTNERRPLLVAKVLSYFESTLPACTFTRVHRSHLVNRQYIKEVIDCKQSGLQIHLVNGEIIGVSRRKKAAFIRSFESGWEHATLQIPLLPPSYSLAV